MQRGIRDAERDAAQGSSRIGRVFGRIPPMAVAATAAAGVAIGATAIKATQAFVGFEEQMNEVFTLLPNASEEAMGKMSRDVREFSKEFGTLPNEVVPALYQSISAGVPEDNVFAFLETAQKAAIGGVTELETAVDGISSVVNAYGDDVLNATEASDLMFTAVRLGKTNFDELSQSLFQVIPTASSLGVEFGDVTAALASMTAQGTPTRVATTQLRQAFVELSKDGGETATLFKELSGTTFKDFIAAGGNTADALGLLSDHAESAGLGVNDLFGSVEAGNAALALTGKGAEGFADNLEAMGESAGATDAAFETMDQGIGRSIDRIRASLSVMMIDIGEKLAPTVKRAADAIVAAMPAITGAILGVVDAFGLLIRIITLDFLGIQDALLSGIRALISPFVEFGKLVYNLGSYFQYSLEYGDHWNDMLTHLPEAIRGPVRHIGHFVAGLHQTWIILRALVTGEIDWWRPLETALSRMPGYMQPVGKGLLWIKDHIGSLRDVAVSAFVLIRDTFLTFADAVTGGWEDDEAIRPIHRFVGNVGLAIDGMIDRVRGGFDIVRDSFLTFFQALSGDWQDDPDILPIHRTIGNLGLMARDLFDTVSGPLGAAWDGITAGAEAFLDAVTDVWDNVTLLVDVFNALRSGELEPLEDALDALPGWLDPVGTAMVEIYDAVSSVVEAFREDGFIAGLGEIVDVMPDVLAALWDLATAIAEGVWNEISSVDWLGLGGDILDGISNAISSAASTAADAGATVLGWIASGVAALTEVQWGAIASTIWHGITVAFNAAVSVVADAGSTVLGWIASGVAALGEVEWGAIASTIWHGITTAFGAAVSVVSDAGSTVFGWISSGVDAITDVEWGEIASSVWEGITTGVSTTALTVVGLALALYDWVAGGVSEVDWVGIASSVWGGIRGAAITAATTATDLATSLYEWIDSGISGIAWADLTERMKTNVQEVWDAAIGGVTAAWGWVSDSVGEVDWEAIELSLTTGLSTAWSAVLTGLDTFDAWLRGTLDEITWEEIEGKIGGPLGSAWSTVLGGLETFDTWLRDALGEVVWEDIGNEIDSGLQTAWEQVNASTDQFDAWLRRTIGAPESGPAFSGDLKSNLDDWTADAWSKVTTPLDQFDAWLRDSIGAPETGAIFSEDYFLKLLNMIDNVDWEKLGQELGAWLVEMVPKALRATYGALEAFDEWLGDLVTGDEQRKEEVGDSFGESLGKALVYGLVGTANLIFVVANAFDEFLWGLSKEIGGALWDWGRGLVDEWFDGFQERVSELDEKNEELKAAVVGWFVDIKDDAIELAEDLVGGVIGFFEDLYDELVGHSILPDLAREVVSIITGMWDDVVDYLQENYQVMEDALKAPFVWMAETFEWDSIKDAATGMWDSIWEHINNGYDTMVDVLEAPFVWFKNNIGGIISQAGTYIVWPLKQVAVAFDAMGGAIVAGLSWIGNELDIETLANLSWSNKAGSLPSFISNPTGAGMGGVGAAEGLRVASGAVAPIDEDELDPETQKSLRLGVDLPEEVLGMGGFVDTLKGIPGGAAEFVGDAASSVVEFIKKGAGWVYDQVLDKFPFSLELPGVLAPLGGVVVDMIKEGLRNAIANGLSDLEAEIAAQEAAAAAAALDMVEGSYSGGLVGWVRPAAGVITQRFGQRLLAGYGPAGHTGVDIAAPLGTSIRAANSGVVTSTGWMGGYGNAIIVKHNGLSTLYGHLSSIGVSAGQEVSAGQPIGLMGSTGYSTGSHLHIEVRSGGTYLDPSTIIPGLATGGIVQKEGIYRLAEGNKPEAVIPLGGNGYSEETLRDIRHQTDIALKLEIVSELNQLHWGQETWDAIYEVLDNPPAHLHDVAQEIGKELGYEVGSGTAEGIATFPDWSAVEASIGQSVEEAASAAAEAVSAVTAGIDPGVLAQALVSGVQSDLERLPELVAHVRPDVVKELIGLQQDIHEQLQLAKIGGEEQEVIDGLNKKLGAIRGLLKPWAADMGLSLSDAIDTVVSGSISEDKWREMLGNLGAMIDGSLTESTQAELDELNQQLTIAMKLDAPEAIVESLRQGIADKEGDLENIGWIMSAAVAEGLVLADPAWYQSADHASGIFGGQLHEQLSAQIADVSKTIQFGIASNWPSAVMDGLYAEKDELEGQMKQVMSDMGVAMGAGLLDPEVAIELGWATTELIEDAVIDQILAMTAEMEDGGASLVDAVIGGMEAGRLDLEQAALLLPDSVIPQLETLEQQWAVKLVEAMLGGNAEIIADTENMVEIITALLNEIGGSIEQVEAQIGEFVEGRGWKTLEGWSNVAPGGFSPGGSGLTGKLTFGAGSSGSSGSTAEPTSTESELLAALGGLSPYERKLAIEYFNSRGGAGIFANRNFSTAELRGLAQSRYDWIRQQNNLPSEPVPSRDLYSWDKMPTLRMGAGGIIDQPVVGIGLRDGTNYILGERGRERVTPMDGNGERPIIRDGDTIIEVDGETLGRAAGRYRFAGSRMKVRLRGGRLPA